MALDRAIGEWESAKGREKKCKCEMIKQIHVHYHHEDWLKERNIIKNSDN